MGSDERECYLGPGMASGLGLEEAIPGIAD